MPIPEKKVFLTFGAAIAATLGVWRLKSTHAPVCSILAYGQTEGDLLVTAKVVGHWPNGYG